jgi:hypothetical protein
MVQRGIGSGVRSGWWLLAVIAIAGCSATPQTSPEPSPTVATTPSPTTATVSAAPSLSPSPEPTATTVITPRPTAAPSSPTPSPVAVPSGPQLIAEGSYFGARVRVDIRGAAHLVASTDGGLFYFTNQSGSWVREQVAEEGVDYSLAVDDAGSAWIAFTRSGGISYVTRQADSFSSPVAIIDGSAALPSLAIHDGRVHVAYVAVERNSDEEITSAALRYGTDASGSWSDIEVSSTGWSPALEVGSDGSVHIVFQTAAFTGPLRYAVSPPNSGSFTIVDGPQSQDPEWDNGHALALGADGRAHVTWIDDHSTVFYSQHDGDWAPAEPVFDDFPAVNQRMAVDPSGVIHVVADSAFGGGGSAYVHNRTGNFVTDEELVAPTRSMASEASVAVDADGRPHIVYVQYDLRFRGERPVTRNHELIYVVGPAG